MSIAAARLGFQSTFTNTHAAIEIQWNLRGVVMDDRKPVSLVVNARSPVTTHCQYAVDA